MDVLLTGGPHAGLKQIDSPAYRIDFPRYSDYSGKTVHDVYLLTAAVPAAGPPVFTYAGEVDPPKPDPAVLAQIAAEDQAGRVVMTREELASIRISWWPEAGTPRRIVASRPDDGVFATIEASFPEGKTPSLLDVIDAFEQHRFDETGSTPFQRAHPKEPA